MDLKGLLERCEKASGPDRELESDIFKSLDLFQMHDIATGEEVYSGPPITSSLDAALSLVERCLPGWDIQMGRLGNDPWEVSMGPSGTFSAVDARASTLPLALLAALLTALAQEQTP